MDIREVFLEKVREVTKANLRTILERRPPVESPRHVERRSPSMVTAPPGKDFQMVVIGSSTGGPPALQTIFSSIQEPISVGFAVAQHMPPDFTKAFAERLNRFSALEIREAADGDAIRPGRVLIAPGGYNLETFRSGDEVIVKVTEPKSHQRYIPSADVLFASAAPVFGSRLLGVVLTGMGNDGARGVQAIKDHGGFVLAEDEESCVVFGMPKEAIATGRVDSVVSLPLMCREILRRCRVTI
jgi:two-component system chemotaxis response regulator CheB